MTVKNLTPMESVLYSNLSDARKVADLLLRVEKDCEDCRALPLTSSSGQKYVFLKKDSDAFIYQIDMEMLSADAFYPPAIKAFDYLKNPISFSAIGMYGALEECIREDGADALVLVEKLFDEIFFGTFTYEGLCFWVSAMSLHRSEKRKSKSPAEK